MREQPVFKNGFPIAPTDQLYKILERLGTPNEEDKSFLENGPLKTYLESYPDFKKIEWAEDYPKASPEALDLLDKILVFNPLFRITVDEALNHPFFKDIRNPENERKSPEVVTMDFDLITN